MPKFRKKPVEITALQFRLNMTSTETYFESVDRFVDEFLKTFDLDDLAPGMKLMDDKILIPTLEGNMLASNSDWIIRGISGEFYPCKDDIFRATYDPVEPNQEGD